MDLPKREICDADVWMIFFFATHSVTKTKERIDRWWRKHPRGRLSTPQVVHMAFFLCSRVQASGASRR